MPTYVLLTNYVHTWFTRHIQYMTVYYGSAKIHKFPAAVGNTTRVVGLLLSGPRPYLPNLQVFALSLPLPPLPWGHFTSSLLSLQSERISQTEEEEEKEEEKAPEGCPTTADSH